MNYRRYRNTDPPALVEVWNETLQYRGNYSVRIVSTFERWLFSKPYFTPNDLIVVEDPLLHRIAGFALVGQGPNEERTALSKDVGVICAIVVRPEFQRRGIGRELIATRRGQSPRPRNQQHRLRLDGTEQSLSLRLVRRLQLARRS